MRRIMEVMPLYGAEVAGLIFWLLFNTVSQEQTEREVVSIFHISQTLTG